MTKSFKKILITVLLFIIVVVVTWQISKSRTFQFFGGIVPRIETNKKIVALTFDDGPTPNTQAVLNILDGLGVKATFFVTGAEMEKYPEEGKRIALAGHELGNHSFSHQRMVLKSPSFIKQEIETTDRLIRQAGYMGQISFRPPNGKKLIGLPYYLKKNNRKTIMWDVEPDSIPEIGKRSGTIIKYVTQEAKPGSIILLHVMYDSRKESLDSIKGIVNSMRSKGYEFVTVSELLREQKPNRN